MLRALHRRALGPFVATVLLGLGTLAPVSVSLAGTAAAQRVVRVPANYPTISQALAAAPSGATVLVEPGRYVENLAWPALDGIRLVSAAGPAATIIDGGGTGRVVTVGAGLTRATLIEGFTIENGLASEGAGLRLASPITVRGNVVTKCEGRDASANRGGGIHVVAGASPRIERNVIAANVLRGGQVNRGAGIYVEGTSGAEVVGNELIANACLGPDRSQGGGAYVGSSLMRTVVFASNVVARNTAQGTNFAQGGGVHTAGGSIRVIGNTITGNVASSTTVARGGGLALTGPTGAVANNIVVRNTVTAPDRRGGGIDCASAATPLDYNDVWRNVPDDYGGCSAGPNDIAVDPQFAGPNDFHLRPSSPCLEAGADAAVGAIGIDADGDARRLDGDLDGNAGNGARVDIGADEVAAARLSGRVTVQRVVAFDVTGAPGSSYTIGVAARRGSLFIAPFGSLLLAPPIAIVGAGATPGATSVALPLSAQLEGVGVVAQALVQRRVGPQIVGQFTNRLDLTLRMAFGRPIVELFTSKAQLDTGSALWAPGNSPGLRASFGFGGTGADGELVVTGNVTLDADTRPAGLLAEWDFQRLTVQSGATLTLTGRRPIRLNVVGACTIDGTVVAAGRNGRNGPAGRARAVGTIPGGRGGPGGGDGGASNVNPTGPIGALPEQLRGLPGYPKANRCNDVNKSDNRLITVVEPNCGGGTGGNRGVPSGSLLRSGCSGNGGGHRGNGNQTDFLCGNISAFGREFGVQWILPTGPTRVQQPTAGTGGGAGGNAAVSASNPRPEDDIVAGSGGGGGGGLEIVAAGSLIVRGSILADGGNGGVGFSTLAGTTTVQAGYGAGGSGGCIWLSGTAVTVDATATLSARGGTGNPNAPNPPRNGDGGDGYIIARDVSGWPTIATGATITPARLPGRSLFVAPGGKSAATSKWYAALAPNPVWAFDANNPQTGVVVPGSDLVFAVPPAVGQQVRIVFQGAPDVNGKPDPNPATWIPRNAFTPDITRLGGKNLRHIRFKIDFDLGPLSTTPPPPQIAVSRLSLRY